MLVDGTDSITSLFEHIVNSPDLVVILAHSKKKGSLLVLPDGSELPSNLLHQIAKEQNKSCIILTCHSMDLKLDKELDALHAAKLWETVHSKITDSQSEFIYSDVLNLMRNELKNIEDRDKIAITASFGSLILGSIAAKTIFTYDYNETTDVLWLPLATLTTTISIEGLIEYERKSIDRFELARQKIIGSYQLTSNIEMFNSELMTSEQNSQLEEGEYDNITVSFDKDRMILNADSKMMIDDFEEFATSSYVLECLPVENDDPQKSVSFIYSNAAKILYSSQLSKAISQFIEDMESEMVGLLIETMEPYLLELAAEKSLHYHGLDYQYTSDINLGDTEIRLESSNLIFEVFNPDSISITIVFMVGLSN